MSGQSNENCIHIVFNTYKYDTRVKKIAKFSTNYFNVKIFCFSENHEVERGIQNGIEVNQLDLLFQKLRFFSPVRHILAYFEFFLKLFFRINLSKIRVIHIHDLKPLPMGVFLKLLTFNRAKLVYDCHEYETETTFYINRPLMKKVARFLEEALIPFADAVICVSDSIASEYEKAYKIPKPFIVLNAPPYNTDTSRPDLFRSIFKIRGDQKIFLYQGGLVRGRGIEETLGAFEKLSEKFVVVFMGYGELESLIKSKEGAGSRIFFQRAVSQEDLPRYTSSADYGLCLIPNVCKSYYYCLPNKVFEYLQSRLPIVMSPLHELKKLASDYKIGVVAEEFTSAGLMNSILRLDSMDREEFLASAEVVTKKFSWEKQEEVLRTIYAKL